MLTAADLDPRVRQNPAARFSACTQKIFFAKAGQPAANLIVGAIPANCVEQPPSMEAFKARTRSRVESDYRSTIFEEGAFHAGRQDFWVLRARGRNRVDGGAVTVEYVATVFAQGLVYWSVEAPAEAAVADFQKIVVHLDAGGSTELVPASVQFAAVAPEPHPAASLPPVVEAMRDALRPDANISHHFESGFGFSYDVPDSFAMLNAQKFDAVLHFVESQKGQSTADQQVAACSNSLLAAESKSHPGSVVIMAHRSVCFGFPLDTGNLPRLGYARLGEFSKRFVLSRVETSVTALGEHPVWAMRASVEPREAGNPMRYLAVLLLPVAEGMAEFVLQTQSRADLDALMATRIRFDDGAESQLFPVSFKANPD